MPVSEFLLDCLIRTTKGLYYYKALHEASEGEFHQGPVQYRYNSLARFFITVMEKSLQDIQVYRARYANRQKLTESAAQILDRFRSGPEKFLKVADLEVHTSLPRRTLQYNLKTLVDMGFLQRLGKGAGSRYQLDF